jgi:hypothetical protein
MSELRGADGVFSSGPVLAVSTLVTAGSRRVPGGRSSDAAATRENRGRPRPNSASISAAPRAVSSGSPKDVGAPAHSVEQLRGEGRSLPQGEAVSRAAGRGAQRGSEGAC